MKTEWEQYLHDVAVYGQGLIYLEEKPMKQIDFSKPLRTDGNKYPARVIQEGLTLVEYTSPIGGLMRATVDEMGGVYALQEHCGKGVFVFQIENVPEEPRDHLVMWKSENGSWGIDSNTIYTKARAEYVVKTWHGMGYPSFLVKVPS